MELVLISIIATLGVLIVELFDALSRERVVRHALGQVRTAAIMPLRPFRDSEPTAAPPLKRAA